jgi:hypothetical protein
MSHTPDKATALIGAARSSFAAYGGQQQQPERSRLAGTIRRLRRLGLIEPAGEWHRIKHSLPPIDEWFAQW